MPVKLRARSRLALAICLGIALTVPGASAQTAPEDGRLPREDLLLYHSSDGRVARAKTKSGWLQRRAEILEGVQKIMGPLPGPEKRCALEMEIQEETDCGTYIQRLVTYASEPGSRVPAYWLIPKAALKGEKRFPAIMALHSTDMKYGHRVLVESLQGHYRAFARDLAERQFVVFAPAYPQMANHHPNFKELGYQSGSMKAIWDNIRAIDFLESLPYVKKGRIGALGHSLGGHNAIYTAVFDERIQVIVSSCGFDSFTDYMGGNIKGWTSERYMAGLLAYQSCLERVPFDFHELIGALAPRYVFINAPLGDKNFDHHSVSRIVDAARPVYRLHGASGKLIVEHPDCGHDFPEAVRERAYRLLRERLK